MSDNTAVRLRTVCSGCFKKGENVNSLNAFWDDKFAFDFGFKCCSFDCAQHIASKQSIRTVIKYASDISKFIHKWTTAEKICDFVIKQHLASDEPEDFTKVIRHEVLFQLRSSPHDYESSNFFIKIPLQPM